jgi:hypothetical protein
MPMSGRLRFTAAIVGASLGGLMVLVGLAIFAGQIATWMDTGRWEQHTLMEAIKTPAVKRYLPQAFMSWLFRPESLQGLHETVMWTLDTMPSAFVLATLGALLLWRSVKW